MPDNPPPQKENFPLNLAFNLIVPSLVLSDWGKSATEAFLSAEARLVIALVFPAAYFIFDYTRRRRANAISIFGFCGILVSGVIGLMKLDPFWFAVKEAAIPGLIGCGLIVSQWLRKPLVREFVWNDSVLNTGRILDAASERGAVAGIDGLFARCTRILGPVFLLSAAAHFVLARRLVTSRPDTALDAFNSELSKFNLIAWSALVLPMMACFVWVTLRFMKSLGALTGLKDEELYR